MRILCTLLLLLSLSLSVDLTAQNGTNFDRVVLRSGTIIAGTITDYKPGKYLRIENERGRTRTYLVEAIKTIYQCSDIIVNIEEDFNLIKVELKDIEFMSEVRGKDGSSHTGKILAYDKGQTLQLELEDGSVFEIDDADIAQIIYLEDYEQQLDIPAPAAKAPRVYEFQETGWFNEMSFGFSFGDRQISNSIVDQPFFEPGIETQQTAIGFNIQHVVGYQFTRLAGVGLGLSYDAYNLEDGEAMVTFFGQYRSYFTRKIVSPFFSLSAGYGIPNKNKNQGIVEADGGWMLHPELGLRLGASSKTNFLISAGYRMQKAYYVQELPFNGDIEYRDLIYRRFLFKLALLF